MDRLDHLSDEDLLRRARGGDEQALRALTERHVTRLHPKIDRRLPPALRRRVAASDIIQEVHLVAVNKLAEFEDRGAGSYERWIRKIVDLKIREALRRHVGAERRELGREVTESRHGGMRAMRSDQPTPSQVAVGHELRDAAREALHRLPEDSRAVLTMLQQDGLTVEEAAKRLGRTVGATRKLYGRALARLESLLDIDDGGAEGRRRPTR